MQKPGSAMLKWFRWTFGGSQLSHARLAEAQFKAFEQASAHAQSVEQALCESAKQNAIDHDVYETLCKDLEVRLKLATDRVSMAWDRIEKLEISNSKLAANLLIAQNRSDLMVDGLADHAQQLNHLRLLAAHQEPAKPAPKVVRGKDLRAALEVQEQEFIKGEVNA